MLSDDATLAEPFESELLRASYVTSPGGAALLRATLEATNVRHRVLALRGLVRQSLMSSDQWLHVLADRDVELRREALQQLAHATLDDRRVLDVVASMLDDVDELVVDAAAFALGEHAYTECVEELCRVARDHEDPRCRETAVAALGVLGDDRARTTVLHALSDKPAIRRRAVVALSNFEGPDIDAALEAAGKDRDWQVRAAVHQLGLDER